MGHDREQLVIEADLALKEVVTAEEKEDIAMFESRIAALKQSLHEKEREKETALNAVATAKEELAALEAEQHAREKQVLMPVETLVRKELDLTKTRAEARKTASSNVLEEASRKAIDW